MQIDPALPPGLRLIQDFITVDEESALLTGIDLMPWSDALKRRTQHYGYSYGYKSRALTQADPIPDCCDLLWPKMRQVGLLAQVDALTGWIPSRMQMIVNEYEPGQGISAHTDAPIFRDLIMSLSLGSACVMVFTGPGGERFELMLPRRSMVVMSGPARTTWKHEIPARKTDIVGGVKMVRERRVSFTFRYV